MTTDAARIAWKDVRQHRAWIAVYLAVVLVRALLIGSGIDAAVRDANALTALGLAYQVLCGLHVALIVTLTVQIVHGDRLVGTTAFWLTRPIARGALLASKLGSALLLLVAVPIAADMLVVARYGLGWPEALGAVADGALLRMGVVLAVMALAAVTNDLAVFVVTAIAAIFVTVAVETLLQWLRLSTTASNRAATVTVFVFAISGAGALAAFAHQVFTRRTARSVVIIGASVALMLAAANRIDRPLVSIPTALEAGWIDPATVTVTLMPRQPAEFQRALHPDRPWQVAAAYEIGGTTPNVVLVPFGFDTTLTWPDGTTVRSESSVQAGWNAGAAGSRFVRKDKVEHLLGDIRLLDAQEIDVEKDATRPIARLTEAEAARLSATGAGRAPGVVPRFDVEATVGALAYEACAPLPLRPGATGRCGNRVFTIVSAGFDGACKVELREVSAAFAVDLRRRSGLAYVLVNKAQRVGLVVSRRTEPGTRATFGRAMFAVLAEHVTVMRRDLYYQLPRGATEMMDRGWLRDSVIVPLQVRDIGTFRVKAKVGDGATRTP